MTEAACSVFAGFCPCCECWFEIVRRPGRTISYYGCPHCGRAPERVQRRHVPLTDRS